MIWTRVAKSAAGRLIPAFPRLLADDLTQSWKAKRLAHPPTCLPPANPPKDPPPKWSATIVSMPFETLAKVIQRGFELCEVGVNHEVRTLDDPRCVLEIHQGG